MKDPLKYTKDEIIKNLILTETHLKQSTTGVDEEFCEECLNKHFYNLEGLGEEGIGFTDDKNEIDLFSEVIITSKNFRGKDYKKRGSEYAQKVRELRKSFTEECENCKTLSKKEIENLSKDLNTSNPFYILADENHTQNSKAELNQNKNQKMVSYTELGMMNAGQFAAEGIRYLAETNVTLMPYEKYISIGGGIGLQALGLFVKMPKALKTISIVAGSNLLANGVIKLVKGDVVTPTVALAVAKANMNANQGVGGYAGKMGAGYAPTFGGPTFAGKVTAKNIPSQYARAGILSGSQAFEAPEHADLIRVD